jgi:hypothetical protein
MDEKETQLTRTAEVPPMPFVSLKTLKCHFIGVYQLNTSQAERMVESSSKSLIQTLDKLDAFLKSKDSNVTLIPVFHNLKGLFLNMGEKEWAGFSKDIESRIMAEEPCNIERVVELLTHGLRDVLSYKSKE